MTDRQPYRHQPSLDRIRPVLRVVARTSLINSGDGLRIQLFAVPTGESLIRETVSSEFANKVLNRPKTPVKGFNVVPAVIYVNGSEQIRR